MILSGEARNALVLIRLSPNQSGPLVSIVGHDHLPRPDILIRDAVEVLLAGPQVVQLPSRPERLHWIPPLLLVSLGEIMFYQKSLLMLRVAAAAAKINAQIQAKKGIQHVDVPPIRAVLHPLAHLKYLSARG
jgi:hypothetical protein